MSGAGRVMGSALPLHSNGLPLVPWINAWSAEMPIFAEPCRQEKGRLALIMASRPGEGEPLFKVRHWSRHRDAFRRHLCEVCGAPTPRHDRMVWPLAQPLRLDGAVTMCLQEGVYHRRCVDHASRLCPAIKAYGWTAKPLPKGYGTVAGWVIVGGHRVLAGDFFTLSVELYRETWPGIPINTEGADPHEQRFGPSEGVKAARSMIFTRKRSDARKRILENA